MDLPDLKQLDKLIALCRKRGVESVEINGLKLTLGSKPEKVMKFTKKSKAQSNDTDLAPDDVVELDTFDSLTPEQKLFWSVQDPTAMADSLTKAE